MSEDFMMTTPELEEFKTVKNERDVLLKIVEGAQRREAEAERTIQLLLLAGHVSEDRVKQARDLAGLK